MKYVAIILTIIALAAVAAFIAIPAPQEELEPQEREIANEPGGTQTLVETIVEGLEVPWDIAFLPEGGMLVTERTGHVVRVDEDGSKHEIPVPGVRQGGEGGLLGLVLHPEFETNKFVYLYMSAPGSAGETTNRIVRYAFDGETLVQDKIIIEGIPGAVYHDGGRMEFGPDGMLYVTTGDATRAQIAQDLQSLGGKILRLTPEGGPASGNPFGTRVYSYGHRNPQGLAWDSAGRLWESEHGRSGVTTGLDEINLIEPGKNYGWPEIEGDESAAGMQNPVRHSGSRDTWAPASLVYVHGSLYFGGLRGEALYEAVLNGNQVVEIKEHFKGEYGRIRTVRVGPDQMLYLTTSNRDGRGAPQTGDDKIIRVNPALLE